MNSKTNEILNDVIHTASQAILCEDEAIKRQAIGDIIDALGSVIPAERVAARGGARALPSGGACRSATAENSTSRCTFTMARAGSYGIVTLYDSDGVRRLQARIEKHADYYTKVLIFKAGDNLESYVTIDVTGGFDRARRIAKCAMKGFLSSIGHKARLRANKLNSLGLTVERELAATVARQMDDDDLAEQIENA